MITENSGASAAPATLTPNNQSAKKSNNSSTTRQAQNNSTGESEKLRPFIPSWMDDYGMTSAQFRIFAHLMRRANKQDIAWPSYESMVEKTGMSRNTIRRSIQFLERQNLIKKIGKKFGDSCRYLVLPIVPLESALDNSNGATRDTIDNDPIVPPETINKQRDGTSIVPLEIQEGNPTKVIQLRESKSVEKKSNSGSKKKSKIDPSPQAMELAIWFQSLLPESEKSKLETFAKDFDALIRIDKREISDIRKVCSWALQDNFWKSKITPEYLRRNNGGRTYFDKFKVEVNNHRNDFGSNKPATIASPTNRPSPVQDICK